MPFRFCKPKRWQETLRRPPPMIDSKVPSGVSEATPRGERRKTVPPQNRSSEVFLHKIDVFHAELAPVQPGKAPSVRGEGEAQAIRI